MREPVSQTPAMDFLRRVEIWQQAPGGTAGIAVAMPEGDNVTLHQLLGAFRRQGDSARLETQARHWLIGYRECNPPLTSDQRSQLDAVIAGLPDEPVVQHGSPGKAFGGLSPGHLVGFAIVLLLALSLLAGRAFWHATHPANPVQQGSQSQSQPQQVPAGTTDLQNFKADWGPWNQLATSQQNPFSGAPALLFMEQGGYYASRTWTVPAGSPAWAPDLGGNVGNVDVQGGHALITDADGNPYTVGVDQPFVFARNPGTVLKIDPTGNVFAIPEAHAVSPQVRHHLP